MPFASIFDTLGTPFHSPRVIWEVQHEKISTIPVYHYNIIIAKAPSSCYYSIPTCSINDRSPKIRAVYAHVHQECMPDYLIMCSCIVELSIIITMYIKVKYSKLIRECSQ